MVPARAWLVVGLLWFAGCSNYLTRLMVVTMHSSIVASVPMTETQFGTLISVFLVTYALANPGCGFLADRWGRSRVITGSMLVWSALTLATAYATTFRQLVALRALLGLAQACYLPAASALIADYHPGPTRSMATGVHMTGVVFGAAVGGLGGWLAELRTWNFAFTLVGAVGLAYGGLLWAVLRDPAGADETGPSLPRPPVRLGRALVSLGRNGAFVITLLYWGLLGAVSWVVTSWMPTYLQEHFHLGEGAAGFSANGYFFIAEMAGLLVGGAWADRWSRRTPRARLYVPVLGLLAAAPGFWLAGPGTPLSFTVATLVLWGLGCGFAAANTMPILCLITDSRYRATGYGLLNAAAAVAGGVAIYTAGVQRDLRVDLSRFLGAAGACVLVCIGLLLLVRPKTA